MRNLIVKFIGVFFLLLLAVFTSTAKAETGSYGLVQVWGEKGTGTGQFNNPVGIAIANGEVFISDTGNSRIQVFDLRGNFLHTFAGDRGRSASGQKNVAGNRLDRPMHMDIFQDRLYVADFNDHIYVFSLSGQLQQVIGSSGTGPGQFDAAAGMTVDSEGRLYVADFYNQRVQVLAANGDFIRQYGVTRKLGIGAGKFNYPTDAAILPDDGLVVADAYNDRIQVFDKNGKFVRKWGGFLAMNFSGSGPGWFKTATGVAISPSEHIFVADFYNNRIQEFNRKGKFISIIGHEGDKPGQFKLPTDMAFDKDGNLYVVDFGNNRIQKFSPGTAN